MNNLLAEYTPSDDFIIRLQKMTFKEYISEYDNGDSEEMPTLTADQRRNKSAANKQLRNDYDNRMRGRNLQIYYMDSLLREQEKKHLALIKVNKKMQKIITGYQASK